MMDLSDGGKSLTRFDRMYEGDRDTHRQTHTHCMTAMAALDASIALRKLKSVAFLSFFSFLLSFLPSFLSEVARAPSRTRAEASRPDPMHDLRGGTSVV